MKRTQTIIIISISILSILFFAVFGIFVWYHIFDVTGLDFYDGDKISKITSYDNKQFYMLTEDGKLYIFGGYDIAKNRKYINSELTEDERLGIPRPVLVSNKAVRSIIPYSAFYALFITEENELYEFDDFTTSKISTDVISAFCDRTTNSVYIIDKDGNLSIVKENEKTFLYSGIKDAKIYRDRLFAVLENGDFCEMHYDVSNDIVNIFEPVMTGVQSFSVLDTSLRYENGSFIYNNEDAISNPLFNILTIDGKLYVKGSYNILECSNTVTSEPVKTFDKWTLIFENVSDFSTTEIGTVVSFRDGGVAYYGFETVHNEDAAFEYKTLLSEEKAEVFSCKSLVIASTDKDIMLWGALFANPFDNLSREHYVLSGTPYVLSKE